MPQVSLYLCCLSIPLTNGREMSEEFNVNRRRFLGSTALAIVIARLGMFGSARSGVSMLNTAVCLGLARPVFFPIRRSALMKMCSIFLLPAPRRRSSHVLPPFPRTRSKIRSGHALSYLCLYWLSAGRKATGPRCCRWRSSLPFSAMGIRDAI